MTAKLIVSVKEVNGIAQVVYYCKERRRIYRKSFADTVREFRDTYRKANKKISCNWRGLRCWASPSAPLPGGGVGWTPTCRACFVIIKKTRTRSTLVSCSLLVSTNNSITK